MAYFAVKASISFWVKKRWLKSRSLEIAGEEFARNLVVQRMMRVVALLEETADGEADLLGIRLCQNRLRAERDGEQARQKRAGSTKEIFHKFGKKSSQNTI